VWLVDSVTEFWSLALGELANHKTDADSQQQSCRRGHLLVYLPNQCSGADADLLLTIQHLPLGSIDLSCQGLG